MAAPEFLIIGLQKSGTYWLTALLNAHPEITCVPAMYGGQTGVEEGHIFDTLGSIDQDNGAHFRQVFAEPPLAHNGYYTDLVGLLGQVDRAELLRRFTERYQRWCEEHRQGARLMGEKTTEYVLHLDLIDQCLPGVKKLCLLRDPRDRIVSFHFHQLRKGQKQAAAISDEYIRDYVQQRVRPEYEALVAYPGNLYCLTYESLSAELAGTLTGVLSYLGATASADQLMRMEQAGDFSQLTEQDQKVADRSRDRGEENRASHYRKGIVGDWRNHITERQSALVAELLGPLPWQIEQRYNINLE